MRPRAQQHRPVTYVMCGFVLASLAGPAEAAQTTPTVAASTAVTPEELERRFLDAKRLYKKGDLRGALAVLTECYELSHDENMQFNLAQLYRELSECGPAISHYRLYIERKPEGERVSDARHYVDVLQEQCNPPIEPAAAAEQPSAAPSPTVSAIDEPHSPTQSKPMPAHPIEPLPMAFDSGKRRQNYWPVAGWVSVGAGALASAFTVYQALEAREASRDIDAYQRHEKPDGSALAARQDDFYRSRTLALSFGTAATLMTGFGLYALIFRTGKQPAQAPSLATIIVPGSALLTFRSRF